MKRLFITLWLALLVCSITMAQTLEVAPNPAEVLLGGALQFSVSGLTEGAAVSWQVLPPSLAAIDAGGRFTAGKTAGQCIVRAMAGEGQQKQLGHALVRIVGKEAAGLTVKIRPGALKTEVGQSSGFSAKVTDLSGGPADDAAVEWKVIPSGLGSVDAQGNFTALAAGTGRLVALASRNRIRGMAQAKISVGVKLKPQKLAVTLSPAKLNIRTREKSAFTVKVSDQNGKPVEAALAYSLEPAGLGTIDAAGNFTAGDKAGVGIVKVEARHGSGTGSAKAMIIVSGQNARYTVKVKPRQVALLPLQTAEFTAQAYDQDGNPVTPPYWIWKAIPEKLGNVSPEGLFTASQKPGVGKVVAMLPPQFGQGQDAASVRVKPGQPLKVKVEPAVAMLLPGQPQQFTATVFSPGGKPMPEVKVIWKTAPEGVGTINQNGLFRASDQPDRKGLVIAQVPLQQGGGQGAAAVSTSAYKISIDQKPGPITLNAGESYNFTATIRDAWNNPVTGLALQWMVDPASQQFGNINQSGVFTAGHPSAPASGWVIVKAVNTPIADRVAVVVKSK
jgi:hypothetical protein